VSGKNRVTEPAARSHCAQFKKGNQLDSRGPGQNYTLDAVSDIKL